MKKILLIIFLSFCLNLSAQNEKGKIMAFCEGKWGDDYSMVKYEYDNQIKAYSKYQNVHKKAKDKPKIVAIYERAKKKWYQSKYRTCDWSMVMYEIENQTDALLKILDYGKSYENDKTFDNIINKALAKWKDGDTFDYSMVLYEIENQIEAYNSLRKEKLK